MAPSSSTATPCPIDSLHVLLYAILTDAPTSYVFSLLQEMLPYKFLITCLSMFMNLLCALYSVLIVLMLMFWNFCSRFTSIIDLNLSTSVELDLKG